MRAATSVEYTPIFNWSPARSRKVSLISFIAASVVLHALCFYIFQIIYPPTVALLPPPARVNMITPASEEGRVLLRWVEAEDPALSSLTQRPPDAVNLLPPKPEHVPSYLTRRPALRVLPPLRPNLDVPSSRPPAVVPFQPRSLPVAASAIATEVKFSADVGVPKFPPAHFIASTKESPQAALFRVAISSQGEVRHCFLENSSGDSSLDEQARHYLLLTRFPVLSDSPSQNENGLIWTMATCEWGNDISPLAPAAASSP